MLVPEPEPEPGYYSGCKQTVRSPAQASVLMNKIDSLWTGN